MKTFFCLAIALTSCSDSSSSPDRSSEAIVAKATPTALTCAYDDYAKYPAGAPKRRVDLYRCSASVSTNVSNLDAFVEIYNDSSRVYHVDVTLKGGLKERIVAEENAKDAAPFTPFKLEAGAAQSSNVLRGMNEETKNTLGLSEAANYRINMKSSAEKPDIEMTVTQFGDEASAASIGLPKAVCYRIGG